MSYHPHGLGLPRADRWQSAAGGMNVICCMSTCGSAQVLDAPWGFDDGCLTRTFKARTRPPTQQLCGSPALPPA